MKAKSPLSPLLQRGGANTPPFLKPVLSVVEEGAVHSTGGFEGAVLTPYV